MNEEMMKNLAVLIDESLAEIEELKKSDRFAASEIKLGDSSSGMGGSYKNGSLCEEECAEKADDDDDDYDDDDDDDDKKNKRDRKYQKECDMEDKHKDMKYKDMEDKHKDMKYKDMDKAEGRNREADPDGRSHKMVKDDYVDDYMDKAEGKNRESDPKGRSHKMAKKEDMGYEIKKSQEELGNLMKSYIDDRISPIEGKLEAIVNLVKELADSPAPSRGASYKSLAPLQKSEEGATETLTKSEVVNKLFELKKSGTKVDSTDIASAELGGAGELAKIITKYNIK